MRFQVIPYNFCYLNVLHDYNRTKTATYIMRGTKKIKANGSTFSPFVLQLCYIDSQTDGGIPSYCFALMVLFFLQQRKPPLLPCLLGSWVSMNL